MRQANKKIRVLAFGTFDLLHPGHHSFLQQAKKLGTELMVVVARDKNVRLLKGITPAQEERLRLQAVRAIPGVHKAMLGEQNFDHRYRLVKRVKPDIIVLGYDQHPSLLTLRQELKMLGLTPRLVRLKAHRPTIFKSSLLRNQGGSLAKAT